MNLLTNIWSTICSWDSKQTEKRDDTTKEIVNREALENINAVPKDEGYVVVFSGYIISEVLDSVTALKLVDTVRRNYIGKKMNNTKDIWY